MTLAQFLLAWLAVSIIVGLLIGRAIAFGCGVRPNDFALIGSLIFLATIVLWWACT